MSWIDDLLKRVPDPFKDLAKSHLPILIDMAEVEMEEWLNLLLVGDGVQAYRVINERMSPQERVEEQKALNALFRIYHEEQVNQADMFREFFKSIIWILIRMGMAEIDH